MKVADLEQRINILDLIQDNHKLKQVGSGVYRVNPCPVCGHDDHFTVYPETNSYSSFSECCTGGSVYQYLIEVEDMTEDAAYKKLLEFANVRTDDSKKEIAPNSEKLSRHTEKTGATTMDYTETIITLYENQSENDRQYFIDRGISPEVIDRYKLSVGDVSALEPSYFGKRAILPVWQAGKVVAWNSRSLESDLKFKYLKSKGELSFFNADHLRTAAPGETLILTEGEFDALSCESVGIKAISLSGVANYKNFINDCVRTDILFLTAFDNDKQGQKVSGKRKVTIPPEYKDINEWLVAVGAKALKRELENQIEAQKRPDSSFNYLMNKYEADVSAYKTFANRKSGFSNLDDLTRMYPGLYVIGGLSSVGKTTFMHQMCDQMAAMGEHILFFSLEMATLELVTKSLARFASAIDKEFEHNNGISATEIRLNTMPDHKRGHVRQAIKDYEPISKRFNIIEGNFETDVSTIRSYIGDYIQANRVKPLVVIDYLQIVPGNPNDRGDKEKIDTVVTELKRVSRDYNITVIVISSLNRQNYLSPIDFEAFKESGGIEYTADVIWGLQLTAIHSDIFQKKENLIKKRMKIKEAKMETPRNIELVCLKNRNGISNYSCFFDYYPKFDTFVPKSSAWGATSAGGARE